MSMIEGAVNNTGAAAKEVSADTGYYSAKAPDPTAYGPIETQGSDSRSPGNPNRLRGADHLWRASTLQVYWIPDDERRGLDERRGPIVAPCPSVKPHFFNKPMLAQLTLKRTWDSFPRRFAPQASRESLP